MGKGFGIAALVLAILSTLSPYGVNFAVIWIGMICAIVAALNGDRGLTIASIVIAGAGLLLFAPLTLGVILSGGGRGDYGYFFLAFGPVAAAVIALVVDAMRRSTQESAPASRGRPGGGDDLRKMGGG